MISHPEQNGPSKHNRGSEAASLYIVRKKKGKRRKNRKSHESIYDVSTQKFANVLLKKWMAWTLLREQKKKKEAERYFAVNRGRKKKERARITRQDSPSYSGGPVLGINKLLSLEEIFNFEQAPNPTKVAPDYHQMPMSWSFVIRPNTRLTE